MNNLSTGMQPASRRRMTELDKTPAADVVAAARTSAVRSYQNFFVGRTGRLTLVNYELAAMLAAPMPGALGYVLRAWWFRRLGGRIGRGVQWGRNISLRHPHKMRIGDNTAIDDHCLLDARGAPEGGFTIGSRVVVARSVVLQAKTGFLCVGNGCSIGGQCLLTSAGGIEIGDEVAIGGQCYLGGARYHTHEPDVPIIRQGTYTLGPIIVGGGAYLGAGVRVLDGVRIGRGAVVGAGAVVTKDVADGAIVAGVPARPLGWRTGASPPEIEPTPRG